MDAINLNSNCHPEEFQRFALFILEQLQLLYPIEEYRANDQLAYLIPNADGFLDEKLGQRQGCVWVRSRPGEVEHLELAAAVSSQTVASITQGRPMDCLNLQSVGAAMVLIEELSHLHLILSHSNNLTSLSQTKLELQAEIDKVLITTLLLYRQTGLSHWLPVIRTSFDYHQFSPSLGIGLPSQVSSHYVDANSIAARFWYSWERHLPDHYHPMLNLRGLNLLRKIQKLDTQFVMDMTQSMSRSEWQNFASKSK